MAGWTHDPSSRGMTTREMTIVNRLLHSADGPLDPAIRPIVADGLRLILELIEARGRRRDFEKQWDGPHDGAFGWRGNRHRPGRTGPRLFSVPQRFKLRKS